jgi:glycosyltransferase involved in cell wall biosynthesis
MSAVISTKSGLIETMAKSTDSTIYINGRFLTQNPTGVQRYSREVVAAIDRLLRQSDCPPQLRETDFVLLAPPGAECNIHLDRIEFRKVGTGDGHAWEQTHLAKHSWTGRLLSPASSGPIWHPRQIVVLHDAGIYNAPAGYSRSYRIVHRALDRLLARRAQIATVSYFSRTELGQCLRIPHKDILLAPNGTDHLRTVSPDETVVDRLGLQPGKYFVTLGLSTANKNIPLAIEAFRMLGRSDTRLVVIGKGSSRVFGSQDLKSNPGVIFTGRLTDEEVTGLLRSATALLFPSRYEGFGIPSLEAMLQGCPVIASTSPGIMEVCGDAALHFHPDKAEMLQDLMRRVLDNPDVAALMRARGLKRPDIYRWDATAAVFIEALGNLDWDKERQEMLIATTTLETE